MHKREKHEDIYAYHEKRREITKKPYTQIDRRRKKKPKQAQNTKPIR